MDHIGVSDTDTNPRKFLTAAEAAAILRVTPVAVADACRSGELRATKPLKAWLIDPADLDAYIAAHYNQGGAA